MSKYKEVLGFLRNNNIKLLSSKKEVNDSYAESKTKNAKAPNRFKIKFNCSDCKKIVSLNYESIKKSVNNDSDDSFKCVGCKRKKSFDGKEVYDEIVEFVENKNAKLVSTKEFINSQISSIDCNSQIVNYINRQISVTWACKCGKEKTLSYYSLLLYTKPILQCQRCSNFENADHSHIVKDIEHFLTSRKCELVTTRKDIIKQIKDIDKLDGKTINGSIYISWKCSCGRISDAFVASIYRRKAHKKLLCKLCAIAKSSGSMSWRQANLFFENIEWKITSPRSSYKTEGTILHCICPNGHETTKSIASLKSGHGCIVCCNESKKLSFEEVEKRFRDRGFKLLCKETDYVDRNTPLLYKCKCGKKKKMSTSNVKRNKKGCIECSIKSRCKSYDDVVAIFSNAECVLLSSSYSRSTDKLDYECWCGTEAKITLKQFVTGVRCKNCAKESKRLTCLEKYGADNPFKSEICKEKIKNTMIKKTGVNHNMKSEECKKKMAATNMKRYGNTMFLHSEKGIETMLELYGVMYGTQDPMIFSKMMASMYGTKPYTFPSGNRVSIQGFENHCIDDFLFRRGYKEKHLKFFMRDEEFPIFHYIFKGKECTYFADMYIPKDNLIVEVKSLFTFNLDRKRTLAKMRQVAQNGYNAKLIIYDSHGQVVKERDFLAEINEEDEN